LFVDNRRTKLIQLRIRHVRFNQFQFVMRAFQFFSIFSIALAAPSLCPCDILGAAGTPCAAAHSTVRALYASYRGPLYNLTRASDGKSFSVPVAANGFADKVAHDKFLPGAGLRHLKRL
jgi:hypothetical protein